MKRNVKFQTMVRPPSGASKQLDFAAVDLYETDKRDLLQHPFRFCSSLTCLPLISLTRLPATVFKSDFSHSAVDYRSEACGS